METRNSNIKRDLVALNAKINYVKKYYSDQTFLLEMYQEKITDLEQKLILSTTSQKAEKLMVA